MDRMLEKYETSSWESRENIVENSENDLSEMLREQMEQYLDDDTSENSDP